MVIISTATVANSIQATSPLLGLGGSAASAGPARMATRTAPRAAVGSRRVKNRGMAGDPPLSRYRSAPLSERAEALPRIFARDVPAVGEGPNALILCERPPHAGPNRDAVRGMRMRPGQRLPIPQTRPEPGTIGCSHEGTPVASLDRGSRRSDIACAHDQEERDDGDARLDRPRPDGTSHESAPGGRRP